MKQEDIGGYLRQRVTSPSRLVFRSAAELLRYSQASRSNYRGYFTETLAVSLSMIIINI